MSGLFGVLDIASRAMMVTQGGVRTTSHNIANVNTPGYSKQRQILQAEIPLPTGAGMLGMGVRQLTIDRLHDEFVERQLVAELASFGATDAQARALAQVEEIFSEQQGEGLSAALAGLYRAFEDLATAPGSPPAREGARAAAEAAIRQLHRMDAALRDTQSAADRSIVRLLPEINSTIDRIRELNAEIQRAEVMAPANDLRDQRDQLVRELAQKVEIQTFERDTGELVVMLPNGIPLVEGPVVRQLVPQADTANPFDPTFSRVAYTDGAIVVDVTAQIGGGELGGLLRNRDTTLPAAIRSLDTLAYNLMRSVNTVHAAGVGLNGAVGDFFQNLAAVENAARDLALDPNVAASSDAIAAGLTPAPGDNRNALALAALRDLAAALYLPGDPPGPATGPARSLLEHAAFVVADVGQQARDLDAASQQQQRVLETVQTRRDEVAGVSLDEEVTNLIRLQHAFAANSRVVSTIDEMLGELLAMI
jgi:flagellar hook-associated protein 1 FlgK